MSKKFKVVITMLMLFSLLLTACAPSKPLDNVKDNVGNGVAEDAGKTKVALITAKHGSAGFVDEAVAGAKLASEEFDIDVDYIETATGSDVKEFETQGRFLAESGQYDLIIFVSAIVADIVELMAGDYPEQKFSIVDTKLEGFDNVRSVGANDPEQHFLSGVLSGIITTGKYKDTFPMSNDKNVLSFAGGVDNPVSRSGAAGYMAGAKYVNPEVETKYTIVGSFNDPATAKEISMLNIANGADVVTGNCGSGIMGILEAAKDQGTYYIATSPSDNDPDYSLACSVKKTDVFVYNEIKGIKEETWEAGHHKFGIKEGICNVSFEGTAFEDKIPQEILDIIDEIRQQVVNGELEMPVDVSDVEAWSASNQYDWKN